VIDCFVLSKVSTLALFVGFVTTLHSSQKYSLSRAVLHETGGQRDEPEMDSQSSYISIVFEYTATTLTYFCCEGGNTENETPNAKSTSNTGPAETQNLKEHTLSPRTVHVVCFGRPV